MFCYLRTHRNLGLHFKADPRDVAGRDEDGGGPAARPGGEAGSTRAEPRAESGA